MGRPQSQCLPVHIPSAKVTANHTHTGDDMRQVITRFDKDNIRANQPLLDLITDFANSKGVTPAQISLDWMLHKNDFIVPIPARTSWNASRKTWARRTST
jgi:aryl-alcohol dehydrogenase-like predicted oxidoreductase